MITAEPFPMPMVIFRDPPDHTLLRKLVSRAFTPRAISGLEERSSGSAPTSSIPSTVPTRSTTSTSSARCSRRTVILALLASPTGSSPSCRDSMDAGLHLEEGQTRGSAARATRPEQDQIIDDSGNLGRRGLRNGARPVRAEAVRSPGRRPHRARHPRARARRRHHPPSHHGGDPRLRRADRGRRSGDGRPHARLDRVLLSRHPEQRAELRADRTLIPDAIEEILRYEAPSPVQGRWVEHDVELHGTTGAGGLEVPPAHGSGDRDERHFDDPDRSTSTGRIDRHLAFGYGAHFCIGSALARLEGRIALEQTLDRFGDWHVDESEVRGSTPARSAATTTCPVRF